MILNQRDNINKIRVVCVDISELDFDEITDHLFCLVQRFGEESLHDLENSEV